MSQPAADRRDGHAAGTRFPVPPIDNRSMLANAVVPCLNYPDVRAAADWLCKAFGFRERLRIADHRSQLQLGTAGEGVVVSQGPKPWLPIDSTHAVMIRVGDLARHHRQAGSAGARIVSPVTTYPYGERQYTAVDPWGHVWVFSETVADVDPEAWGGTLLEDNAGATEPSGRCS
ncbi:MAG TPA: VOC family protein [Rhodanobacteraceae bacterium]|jgi:uncharacterized glyoxalase superfamily protein PhnB|nr:VOC family protein [Rhodanobacteraceae bacterium]